MPVTVAGSGLYAQTMSKALRNTIALDMVSTSHKLALVNVAKAVDFANDTTFSTTNEVYGTNWPTGGIALSAAGSGGTSTAPTLSVSAGGLLVYDMANIVVAGVAVQAARALQLYADALADELILLIDFGVSYDVNGTLSVRVAEAGVARWRVVPVPT